MKFQVEFVNEANLAKLLEDTEAPKESKESKGRETASLLARTMSRSSFKNSKSGGSLNAPILHPRQFRYEMVKGIDLPIHILNIHRALTTLGLRFVDTAPNFALRMRPHCDEQTVVQGLRFPVYLPERAADIDALLLEASAVLSKSSRRKGFILEYVISPTVRAERFTALIKESGTTVRTLKETAFLLASQIRDQSFAEAFVEAGGVSHLLEQLLLARGNTIAYTVNALGATIQASSAGLAAFKELGGITKLFQFINSPVLLAARRATEVLHFVCEQPDQREAFFEAMVDQDYHGLVLVFGILESGDLNTRLAALRIVNQLLRFAPSEEAKQQILARARDYNVSLSLQRSLCIATPEMVAALRQFEQTTGTHLSESTLSSNESLKERILELEAQLAVLQGVAPPVQENAVKEVTKTAEPQEEAPLDILLPLEDGITEPDLSFSVIDFAEELRQLENLDDLDTETAEEEILLTPHSPRTKRAYTDFEHVRAIKLSSEENQEQEFIPPAGLPPVTSSPVSSLPETDRSPKGELSNSPLLADLEKEVRALQQEKSSLEIEKYRLELSIGRLQADQNSSKDKKRKLQQVIQSLQQKRLTLLEECDHAHADLAQIKEEFKKLPALEGESPEPEPNIDIDHEDLDASTKTLRLEKLVCSLIEQKRVLTARIQSLESTEEHSD